MSACLGLLPIKRQSEAGTCYKTMSHTERSVQPIKASRLSSGLQLLQNCIECCQGIRRGGCNVSSIASLLGTVLSWLLADRSGPGHLDVAWAETGPDRAVKEQRVPNTLYP